ncbi:hypothetical protein EV2_028755 [Malus domestica]
MNECGKKRHSLPAQEMLVEKKPKTSSTACEGPLATERLVIDLTSSIGKKNKAARSEPMTSTMPKIASTITYRIAQRKGFVMPLMSKSIPRHLLGAKFGSPLERLTTMKSDKVDFAAKVASTPNAHSFCCYD